MNPSNPTKRRISTGRKFHSPRILTHWLGLSVVVGFLTQVFPTLFLGEEFVSGYGMGLLWVFGLIVDGVETLIAFGAVRGTVRFHQLEHKE